MYAGITIRLATTANVCGRSIRMQYFTLSDNIPAESYAPTPLDQSITHLRLSAFICVPLQINPFAFIYVLSQINPFAFIYVPSWIKRQLRQAQHLIPSHHQIETLYRLPRLPLQQIIDR
jgi:hypothetical protein